MSIDCIAALRSCVWLLEDVASLESLQAGLGATSFSDTTAICVSQTFDHTDSSVWWLFQRLILTFVPTLAEIRQIHAKSTLLEQSVHQIWREALAQVPCIHWVLLLTLGSFIISADNLSAPCIHSFMCCSFCQVFELTVCQLVTSASFLDKRSFTRVYPVVVMFMSFSQSRPRRPAHASRRGFCYGVCRISCRLWQHLSFCLEVVARTRSRRRWSAQAIAGHLRL